MPSFALTWASGLLGSDGKRPPRCEMVQTLQSGRFV